MATPVCVQVAFNDTTLAPSPTWTSLTDTPHLVASFQIDRGRAYELDRTDTGTATVTINDQTGLLDPTNPAGTYYGKLEPLLQIQLALLNPVTNSYGTLFRGFIEDFDYDVSPVQNVTALKISCVDAFEILTAIEMQPNGSFGNTVPADSIGNIYFEQNYVGQTTAGGTVYGGRMNQVLGNAGWPVALQTIFSGNVTLQPAVYSPGENVLQVLQDCADADLPGVGNVYVSKKGFVTFHGRRAKFNPVSVAASAGGAWTFTHWQSGDHVAVAASPGTVAQVRSMSFNRGLSKIINSALATPNNIGTSEITTQGTQDNTSIGQYGFRSWSAENLFTFGGAYDGLDANDETKLYAKYYVQNYGDPKNRISSLSFRHMAPTDTRAAPNWALLCGAEISDLIDVNVKTVGTTSGGFGGSSFFIEGVHYDVQPAVSTYADVTLTLDLSPQAYYTTDPFTYTYAVTGVRALATAAGKVGSLLETDRITGVRALATAAGKAGFVTVGHGVFVNGVRAIATAAAKTGSSKVDATGVRALATAAISPDYAVEVAADNPLLWLRESETSGTSLANAGSLGGNATTHGTVTVNQTSAPGIGRSVLLGGTISDYVDYPYNASLEITGDVTYEAWFKTSSFTPGPVLISKGSEAGGLTHGYMYRIGTGRQVEVIHDGVVVILTSTGVVPNDSAWHYAAFTRSGNTYTAYIDGQPAGNVSSSEVIGITTATATTIGADNLNGTKNSPLIGNIDEPAVYNTALSAARILKHYNAGANVSHIGTILIA